jgi:hypothetical protein
MCIHGFFWLARFSHVLECDFICVFLLHKYTVPQFERNGLRIVRSFVMDELESLRVPPKPVTMNGTGVVLNYIKRIHAARQVWCIECRIFKHLTRWRKSTSPSYFSGYIFPL